MLVILSYDISLIWDESVLVTGFASMLPHLNESRFTVWDLSGCFLSLLTFKWPLYTDVVFLTDCTTGSGPDLPSVCTAVMIHCRGLRKWVLSLLSWVGPLASHLFRWQTENHVLEGSVEICNASFLLQCSPSAPDVQLSSCPSSVWWGLFLSFRIGRSWLSWPASAPAQQACGSHSAYCFVCPFCVSSLILVLNLCLFTVLTVSFQACISLLLCVWSSSGASKCELAV